MSLQAIRARLEAGDVAHARQDIPALLAVAKAAAELSRLADRTTWTEAEYHTEGEDFENALRALRDALATLEELP